ncbi:MAG: DUF465 domain-containing protein [Epsilonproteobacteria bacterium]|nr:DUF465 domain-containing protein [Campylobacterota bacterium]
MFKECCPELIPVMQELAKNNAHIDKLIQRHEELNKIIDDVEHGREHMDDLELEKLKKEKLHIKDEIYQAVLAYKKEKSS